MANIMQHNHQYGMCHAPHHAPRNVYEHSCQQSCSHHYSHHQTCQTLPYSLQTSPQSTRYARDTRPRHQQPWPSSTYSLPTTPMIDESYWPTQRSHYIPSTRLSYEHADFQAHTSSGGTPLLEHQPWDEASYFDLHIPSTNSLGDTASSLEDTCTQHYDHVEPWNSLVNITPALSSISNVSCESYFDTFIPEVYTKPIPGFVDPQCGTPLVAAEVSSEESCTTLSDLTGVSDLWNTNLQALYQTTRSEAPIGLGLDLGVTKSHVVDSDVDSESEIPLPQSVPVFSASTSQNSDSGIPQLFRNESSSTITSSSECTVKSPATRRKWTREEDDALVRAISLYSSCSQKWKRVAEVVPGRNPKLCAKRWDYLEHTSIRGVKKGRWAPEEDTALIFAVNKWKANNTMESINWNDIAHQLPLQRSGPQAQARYTEKLDPSIKSGSWTAQEDALIRSSVREFGSSWLKVSERLPGRTQRQCRMRYFLIACQRENMGGLGL